MLLFWEALAACVFFTLAVLRLTKDPIKTLYNYPPKIQKRVRAQLGLAEELPTFGDMLRAKGGAMAVIALLLAVLLRYLNGCGSFWPAFWQGYLLWSLVNLYDALVIDICWFCRDPRFILPGTEDMTEEYHNYGFHLTESLKGELLALPVCLAAAGLVLLLP